jgi:hypothetical protein
LIHFYKRFKENRARNQTSLQPRRAEIFALGARFKTSATLGEPGERRGIVKSIVSSPIELS